MQRTTGVTVGLILSAILGLTDAVGLLTDGGDGPPVEVLAVATGLGALTLFGVVLGWRGGRAGIAIVIVTRLLAALLAVPAFFVDGVPAPLVAFAAVGIAATLAAVVLVAPALRTRREPAVA
jgi:hypothetical protein